MNNKYHLGTYLIREFFDAASDFLDSACSPLPGKMRFHPDFLAEKNCVATPEMLLHPPSLAWHRTGAGLGKAPGWMPVTAGGSTPRRWRVGYRPPSPQEEGLRPSMKRIVPTTGRNHRQQPSQKLIEQPGGSGVDAGLEVAGAGPVGCGSSAEADSTVETKFSICLSP